MKETICTAFGLVGSFIAALFGGLDSALATLLIFYRRGLCHRLDGTTTSSNSNFMYNKFEILNY